MSYRKEGKVMSEEELLAGTEPIAAGKKRTRAAAGQTVKLPSALAIITNRDYQYGISFYQRGRAYLQPIKSLDGYRYQNERYTLSRKPNELFTDEDLSKFDLMLLRAIYSIILHNNTANDFDNTLSEAPFTIYLPDFLRMIGMKSMPNRATFDSLYKKFENLQFLLGITDPPDDIRRIYPVIYNLDPDRGKNTVSFSSPYICNLIRLISQSASQNKNDSGLPRATHSYLIKPSLVKENNKRAAEIVVIVVALIEQARKQTPHIKASTILDRHLELKQAYEKASSGNKSVILKRAFQKAWVMLREQTELASKYNDPVFLKTELPVPTIKTLDRAITFENRGKSKSSKPVNDGAQ